MWRLQFFGPYDWLVLGIGVLTLLASGWAFIKALPTNTSNFAAHYYEFQWANSKVPYKQLSPAAIQFLGSLSPGDQERVRRGLGYICLEATAGLHDLAFTSKVSSSVGILPLPAAGPWLGDGQFTTHNEVEFLIDKGLLRQIAIPQTIEPGKPLELFCGNSLVVVSVHSSAPYNAYVATSLARELLLAGIDAEYWLQTMLWRLNVRIFPSAEVQYGQYEIAYDSQAGRAWVQSNSLKKYVQDQP